MDVDSSFVESEDDAGEDRQWWKGTCCPCWDSCTKSSWHRVPAWSYESEEKVRHVIKEHLIKSELHLLGAEEAEIQANAADVEECTENADDRAKYRRQVKKAEDAQKVQNDKSKGKCTPKGTGKDKAKRKDWVHSDEVEQLSREVKRLKGYNLQILGELGQERSDRGEYAASPSSRQAPIGGAIVRRPPLGGYTGRDQLPTLPSNLNVQKIELVKDSIDRAKKALSQSQRLLNSSAAAFQERSAACIASASQLAEEVEVLNAAKELLTEMANQLGMNR